MANTSGYWTMVNGKEHKLHEDKLGEYYINENGHKIRFSYKGKRPFKL